MAERSEDDVTAPRIPCRSASEGKEKQQEGRAMATLDRKVPSPEAFLGKPWSSWIDAAKLHCSDNGDLEETGKEGGKSREVMRLNKEDMHLFGHYPGHDDFYLVVCNVCNQVVKPQVFQSHCERRHGSMCKPSPSPASSPSNIKPSHVQMKPKPCMSSHNPVNSNSKPFKAPRDNLLTSNNKQHTAFSSKVSRDKPCVPVPVVSLEKIPNLVKADGANVKMNSVTNSSTTAASSASSLPKQPAVPKTVPQSPEKILNGKGIGTLERKHQNGTKTSNKPYKRLSEREFDPNKHCGVLDPETKKPCTRSLTCKTHSLNHRRAVPGRKKQFDILLAEHKARSREKEVTKDKEHAPSSRETHQSQPTPAQEQSSGVALNSVPEPKVTSPAKSRPQNSALPRPTSANSINSASSSNHSAFVPEPPVSSVGGDLASRLSSDEGEVEGVEETEKLDCFYSGHHPKPLAFCSFGSRLMGRGYYVFDRRWDRFRFALNSMVEKHLNSQMWKKIPPAADSPMPSPVTHVSSSFPASVLQPFSNPNSVYLSSPGTNSRTTSSYMVTSGMLTNMAADTNSLTSHPNAFSHATGTLNIVDSTFKSPSAVSPVPTLTPSPSQKPSKTKPSKSSKIKDLSSRSEELSGNRKKKPQTTSSSTSSSLPLQTSSTSSFSGSHKKNCVLNSNSGLNSYQATSSYNSVSVHNANNGTSPLSAKLEPPGRTSLSGGPADSIKHMSMVVSSIDSSLSVSSLVHHPGEHTLAAHNAVSSMPLTFDKSEGKKRKNSSASSKACKITKMPGMNSVHKKSTANLISSVPDTQNSSLSRQMGKSSSIALSQSTSSSTSSPAHNKQTSNRTGRIRTVP
ncbi:ataxin-7-like protein 1 isoform X2 [Xenopus tropicalis]|uniref:Ataxin-7-like protein 1 isoform X2 n=1 Tax=Xenopus tropicalis TaxID=8364 RepID=A0A8J0QZZ1_XENTR|nr:ataxin-7-like protein 1 isoform X2 [Xenopus tropicalis]|eukprot:XP_004913067.1 PREDICTED: ataxin-7-like protein 1 isoform X2 [Xenopus tropicalis]